jgi:TPR repeat protein
MLGRRRRQAIQFEADHQLPGDPRVSPGRRYDRVSGVSKRASGCCNDCGTCTRGKVLDVAPYELLKIMADSGSPSFQIQFASKLLSGIEVKYDVASAYRYLLMAEAQEELEAKVRIGKMFLDGMVPEGMPTAEQHQRTFSLLRGAVEGTAPEPGNPCRLRALFRMG